MICIYKKITAKTVTDLRNELNKIIDAGGSNCEWNGFDDESIYIYENTEFGESFEINPGNDNT